MSTTLASSSNSSSHEQSSPVRHLLTKLVARVSTDKTFPRKLVSVPFASSLLLLPPLPPEQASNRRLQLQRITDIAVLDATRDKNQLNVTMQISLQPDTPKRDHVGIFVPNNTVVVLKKTKTFENVNQLSKLLTFCVRSDRGDHVQSDEDGAQECKFCSELRAYLGNHHVREPLVAITMGNNTVLRKGVLAKFLVQLVVFATGRGKASPRFTTVPGDKTSAVTQRSASVDVTKDDTAASAEACAAQLEVASVLYDFLDVFPPAASSS